MSRGGDKITFICNCFYNCFYNSQIYCEILQNVLKFKLIKIMDEKSDIRLLRGML